MQLLKRTLTYKLVVLCLSFGVSLSAIAGDYYFDNTLILANKGDLQAQIEIANMYRSGDANDYGSPEYNEAFKWYMKAANQGLSLIHI